MKYKGIGLALVLALEAVVATGAFPLHAQGPAGAAVERAIAQAEVLDPSGQPAETEAAWREVLVLDGRRSAPDTLLQVRALNRIADSRYYRGRPDLAQTELERAVALLETAGLDQTDAMSETLTNLGVILSAQDHADRDVDLQRRALAIRIRLHGADDNRLAPNYFNLGNALYERGLLSEAADNIERGAAMRLASTAPDDPELFITLASAAGIVSAAGRPEKAIGFAQQAVDLVNRYHPGHPYTGFVRGVLGKALAIGGRASEAVTVIRQAYDELAATMGREHRLTGEARSALAKAQAQLGHFDEAMMLTLASLREEGRSSLPEQVRDYISAANYAAEAGQEDQALDIATQGMAFAHEHVPADHRIVGEMALTLAMTEERHRHEVRALSLFREARDKIALHEETGSTLLLRADIFLGGSEIRAGHVDEGYARVTGAAEALVPRMLEAVEAPALGSADTGYYDTFARAAEAAVDAGRGADAFRYVQLAAFNSVARASNQVALRKAAGQGSDAAAMVRDLQDAQRDLRGLDIQLTELLSAGKSDAADAVRQEMAQTRAAIEQTRGKLGVAVPDFARLNAPRPAPLAAVQARLGKGDAVFLALPSRMRTTLMLVTADTVHLATSASGRAAMRAHVAGLRRSIDTALLSDQKRLPAFDLAASHALYDELFPGSFRKAVRHIDHLYVAATDALAQLPFSMLVMREPGVGGAMPDWLIREMSVEVPVTLAAVGGADDTIGAHPAFAGIGAPELGGSPGQRAQSEGLFRHGGVDLGALRDLPPLPGAADELKRMLAAFPGDNAALLSGTDANEAAVKRMDLTRYSVLAFATHGLIAGELDGLEEPALVLTPPLKAEDGNDGLLTATEIADLHIPADFVVLSACNSAAGVTRAAPAYTGLAHAFLYAGAKSLLLSHWKVRDDAAARLSVATVRGNARGKRRADALREATLDLMDDKRVPGGDHPAIWAPFILVSQ